MHWPKFLDLIVVVLFVADNIEAELNAIHNLVADSYLCIVEKIYVGIGEIARVPRERHHRVWQRLLVPVKFDAKLANRLTHSTAYQS